MQPEFSARCSGAEVTKLNARWSGAEIRYVVATRTASVGGDIGLQILRSSAPRARKYMGPPKLAQASCLLLKLRQAGGGPPTWRAVASVHEVTEQEQEVTELDKKLTERATFLDTQMKELIAKAQEKLLWHVLERKRARDQLEEMERTAQPVHDHIDPIVMKKLGISLEVEYMVSPDKSRYSVRRHGGDLLVEAWLLPESIVVLMS
uniref:Uncharacterized protein n=1 Tax=Oryza brachyantha TaxID=4533 RepID=J3M5V5_ORYBR